MATYMHNARRNNVVACLRASGTARVLELSCYDGPLIPQLAGCHGNEIKNRRWIGATKDFVRQAKWRCSIAGSLTTGAFTPQAL